MGLIISQIGLFLQNSLNCLFWFRFSFYSVQLGLGRLYKHLNALVYFVPHFIVESDMRLFLTTNKFYPRLILTPAPIALWLKQRLTLSLWNHSSWLLPRRSASLRQLFVLVLRRHERTEKMIKLLHELTVVLLWLFLACSASTFLGEADGSWTVDLFADHPVRALDVRVSKDHLFMCIWAFYVMIAVISVSTCLPIDFLERLIQLAPIFGHFLFELRFGDIKSLNQVAVLHTSAIELYRIEKKSL